jgi:hypothetical protein
MNYSSIAIGNGQIELILTAARQEGSVFKNGASLYQCLSVFICGFKESSEWLR